MEIFVYRLIKISYREPKKENKKTVPERYNISNIFEFSDHFIALFNRYNT